MSFPRKRESINYPFCPLLSVFGPLFFIESWMFKVQCWTFVLCLPSSAFCSFIGYSTFNVGRLYFALCLLSSTFCRPFSTTSSFIVPCSIFNIHLLRAFAPWWFNKILAFSANLCIIVSVSIFNCFLIIIAERLCIAARLKNIRLRFLFFSH